MMPNVGKINLRSTYFYLIDCPEGKLMFDAGWAGQMRALRSRLVAYGVELKEIKYVMFSHAHPDHADLVQEIKQACGARLIIHEVQIPHLAELAEFHARKGQPYVPVRVEKSDLVVTGDSPRIPEVVGLGGWVVPTPGHSPDHVALVLDDGKAFTGDLPPAGFAGPEDSEAVRRSWRKLFTLGAWRFYPAHGEAFEASPDQTGRGAERDNKFETNE